MVKTLNLNARVSPEQKARLIALSGGSISKGVREALDLYFEKKEASQKAEALGAKSVSA